MMKAMNSKPHVLHIIDHTDSGGSQAQLVVRFSELQRQFVFSLAVLGRSGEYTERYRSLGVDVHPLQVGDERWSLGSFLPLVKLIRQEKPDLIHAHLFKSMSFAVLAALLTGTPCIIQDHSGITLDGLKFYFPSILSRSLYTIFLQLTVRSNVRMLVFTPGIRDGYIRNFHAQKEKINVLPNGIDLERFQDNEPSNGISLRAELGLPHDCKIMTMVGRLAPEKDWTVFLEIASKFPDPDRYAFVAVGSGELGENLRKIVFDKGLSNVHFLGQRQDIPLILKGTNVFLLTSRFEAFGNVIVEAMASSCPVIATRTAGAEFIIQHESNGMLVDVGDVPGFVSTLERVLSDSDLAGRLVQNARKSVIQYDNRVVSGKLSDLYSEVIQTYGVAQS